MGSPPPPSEGNTLSIPLSESTLSSTTAGPSRTLHSFFGGPSASTSSSCQALTPTPTLNGNAPKRRRKKDENQAKLGLSGNGGNEGENGINWIMGKPVDKPEPKSRTNGTKKLGTDVDEEEEIQEMVKKGNGRGRGKRKSDIHDITNNGNIDDLIDPLLSQPNSSPPRKKGKSRKSQINSSSIDYPSASIPSILSGSISTFGEAGPSNLNIHRPSIEFEVTGQSITPRALNTFSSKGSDINDAIEIDQNSSPNKPTISPMKVPPKKIAFAADKKPQHSFFSRLNANTPTVSEGNITENISRASSVLSELTNNTVLSGEEGPSQNKDKVKGKGKEKQLDKDKKKVHGFFKGVSNANEGVLKNGWGNGIKDGEELIAPLPRGDWPNHLVDSQVTVFPDSYAGPSRRKRHEVDEAIDDGFWYSVLENSNWIYSETSNQRIEPFSIPPYISQHPAFTSISTKSKSKSKSNRESWSDRYKPLKSSEVLSNEVEATYLKDWLSTLSVGHHEVNGKKVIRKVRRGGIKPGLLDGWIVDDIGLFGDLPPNPKEEEEEEEELEDLDDPIISPNPAFRSNSYPLLTERLTNTILLTGPNGSGKSSAVYAAANELGWDVFEVFPGMGKRTSSNLMSWVGDVGKNHMVAQDKKVVTPKKDKLSTASEKLKEKKGGLTSFFGKPKQPEPDKKFQFGSQGSAHEPIDIDMNEDGTLITILDEDNDENDEIQILGNSNDLEKDGKVRQSLILIDEVDILFDEESTFWPAVISLIAESRRPVILTCNDHNLIPKFQLPLQAILQFLPPPSYIALPYLQTIAIEEAKNSNKAIPDIQAIYQEAIHQKYDILDMPLPPNGNERIPYFDLRKAIGQLQLDRNSTSTTNPESACPQEETSEEDLDALVKRLEITSYVGAWVKPKDWMQLEVCEVDRHYPTTDDVLGIHALIKPEIRESLPVLAGYDYSSSISDTLISLGGGEVEEIGKLAISRMKYIRSTLPILDPLIPLSSSLLPHSSLFLYTLPIILGIIEIDDILQAAEEEAVKRGEERINRKTGRPMRGGQTYMRWLMDLDEEGEEVGRSLIGGLR